VDPQERVLLLHYLTPDTDEDFWCTPGGARDHSEDDIAAARRELREELGHDIDAIGACVATREHVFRIGDGRVFHQQERFFLLRTEPFEPVAESLSEFERRAVVGYRWWPLDELRAPGDAAISPVRLGGLVERLLREGAPAVPHDAGP
jgi:8-oxo-dGTP pyrophosphatase MutT (NUDIX family)